MNEALKEITGLCNQLKNKQKELEKLEQDVTDKQAEIKRLSGTLIPDILKESGLQEIKLEDGTKISYEKVYFANISEDRAFLAFKWLRSHKFDAFIKKQLTLKFGQGMEERVDYEVLTAFLAEKEIEFAEKEGVHPQTLKKFVKDRIEFENEVTNKVPEIDKLPRDVFGVFEDIRTVVEEPKTTTTTKP